MVTATANANTSATTCERRRNKISVATISRSKISSSSSLLSLSSISLSICISISILLVTKSILFTEASPHVISDDRVRSLDTSPALGRGYSIMTNGFLSTCLMVDETTVPSYNYDFRYTDLTGSTNIEAVLGGDLSNTFGYPEVKAEIQKKTTAYETRSTSSKTPSSKPYFIIATMRIERYYSSVREELSPLSEDAIELLDREDYVGFFKSCGASYIRSIRRAQEVTAIFSFVSANKATSVEFASKVQTANVFKTADVVGLSNVVRNDAATTVLNTAATTFQTAAGNTFTSTSQTATAATTAAKLSPTETLFEQVEAREQKNAYRSPRRSYAPIRAPVTAPSVSPIASPTPSVSDPPTKLSFAKETKYNSITNSLEVKIMAYGLGLNSGGSTSMVATSLEEFDEVMRFAFLSMTTSDGLSATNAHHHVGMVYGIEVIPWVNNPSFQVAAKIHDETILVPLPRSMIPKAFPKKAPSTLSSSSPSPTVVGGDGSNGLRCRDPTYVIDKYNYCCEATSLYDPSTATYIETTPKQRVCRPLRSIDDTTMKDNMSVNGEFVARMDDALRNRQNKIFALEQCITSASNFPDRYDSYILKTNGASLYDATIETSITLSLLKLALDPLGDYSLVRHLSEELDEYVDMYYRPCMAALFGTNVGTTSDVEAKYFMAYPWHTHDECMYLSCLAENMRWDRAKGGCIPGMIAGAKAKGYDDGDDKCSYDGDLNEDDDLQVCKYSTTELSWFHGNVTSCWEKALPDRSIDDLMEHFCEPHISGDTVDGNREKEIEYLVGNCTAKNGMSLFV